MEFFRGLDPDSGSPIEVVVDGTLIKELHRFEPKSGEKLAFLSRGFIDIQVNGYKGIDYSEADLTTEKIERLALSLVERGTTQHLATIVTRPREQILRNIRAIVRARHESPRVAHAIVGIHLEGPFLSPEDGPRGAHDARYLRLPDFEEFLEWQDAAEGLVRIVTLAPELDGALDFIEKITAKGIIAAIGHTAASPEKIRDAISVGCALSTHLGNGSHVNLPRLRNYLWEQLASDELMASVIADGFHLPPAVVKTFFRTKQLGRLVLISDAAQYGGMPPGRYHWGNIEVEVFADGHIGLANSSFLAGAGHLLDWNIAHFMEYTGCSLAEAIRLCTINPAQLLARTGLRLNGCLGIGTPADFVLFNRDEPSRLSIVRTVFNGEIL